MVQLQTWALNLSRAWGLLPLLGGFQKWDLGQFGSPSKPAHLFPLAHPHLALTCGPGSLFLFSWLPLICGHPATAARGLLGSALWAEAAPCHHSQPRKIEMGMEYLPSDCLTASENSSNPHETPRNAEPQEEEPRARTDSFSFLLGCGEWSQGRAGITKPMVVLISCKPGMWGLIVFV